VDTPVDLDTTGGEASGIYTSTGATIEPATAGLEIAMLPLRTATGMRSARFQLMLSNRSDESRAVDLSVEAGPGAAVSLPSSSVMLAPRQERRIDIHARPTRRRWFGGKQERSFTIVASGGGQPPRRLDGRFSDDSMGWLPLGAGGGLLGAGGIAIALFLAGGEGDDPPLTPTATSGVAGGATATAASTPTLTATPGPAEPAGLIAFESNREGDFNIYVMHPDGSGVTRLTPGDGTDYEPSWSPDGTQIVFASQATADAAFDLFIMNADGSGLYQVTFDMDAREPVWSPDGSRIAFYSNVDGNDDIYVVAPDGSAVERLTTNPESDIRPSWSPDGSRLAFTSQRFGNWDVFVMNADGSALTRVTDESAFDWSAAWSPDGSHLIFASDRDGHSNLYLMNPDGSEVQQVTFLDFDVAEPSWAPDGLFVVFAVDEGSDNRDIYVLEFETGDLTKLSDSEDDDDGWPAWAPPGGDRQLPTLPATATPTSTPEVTATVPVGGTLFSDDFNDPSGSGFEGFDAQFYRAGYADGEFVIEQFNTGTPFFAAVLVPGHYLDASFYMHVRVVGDPPDPVVGMACRLQDRDGYRFTVRPQTFTFAIEKVLNGQVELIYPHTESESIFNDINYLQMSCIGNTISVWANGAFLASVTDDTFKEGNLFIATTSQDGFIEARFDNLLVIQE
jgi:TolB protein